MIPIILLLPLSQLFTFIATIVVIWDWCSSYDLGLLNLNGYRCHMSLAIYEGTEISIMIVVIVLGNHKGVLQQ